MIQTMNQKMKKVIIHSKHVSYGNTGVGAWCAVLRFNETEKEISGKEENVDSTTMPMISLVKTLEALREPCDVEYYTDRVTTFQGITKGWFAEWKKHNWTKGNGSRVTNTELIDRLYDLYYYISYGLRLALPCLSSFLFIVPYRPFSPSARAPSYLPQLDRRVRQSQHKKWQGGRAKVCVTPSAVFLLTHFCVSLYLWWFFLPFRQYYSLT